MNKSEPVRLMFPFECTIKDIMYEIKNTLRYLNKKAQLQLIVPGLHKKHDL